MTTTTKPRALNLALLVSPLPPVIFPNGSERELVFTAEAAECYREVREFVAQEMRGETIDNLAASDAIDRCLRLCVPTATADDLATLGFRTEVKLSVLAAAAGRVDHVLASIAEHAAAKTTAAEGAPLSPHDTTSAP